MNGNIWAKNKEKNLHHSIQMKNLSRNQVRFNKYRYLWNLVLKVIKSHIRNHRDAHLNTKDKHWHIRNGDWSNSIYGSVCYTAAEENASARLNVKTVNMFINSHGLTIWYRVRAGMVTKIRRYNVVSIRQY